MKIGDPLEKGTLLGPLHTPASKENFVKGIQVIKSQACLIDFTYTLVLFSSMTYPYPTVFNSNCSRTGCINQYLLVHFRHVRVFLLLVLLLGLTNNLMLQSSYPCNKLFLSMLVSLDSTQKKFWEIILVMREIAHGAEISISSYGGCQGLISHRSLQCFRRLEPVWSSGEISLWSLSVNGGC